MNKKKEKERLNKAIKAFAKVMRDRLYEKVEAGYTGWDDPIQSLDIALQLYTDAHEAAFTEDTSHLHDIANRAMMLWYQNQQDI